MRSFCGPARNGVLVLAGLYFSSFSWAAGAVCKAPPDLDAKFRAHPTTENALALGNWYGSRQQYDCAAETFRVALKTAPKSAQLHYLEGMALAGSKHTAEAIEALQKSAQLDTKALPPHLLLATLYQQDGQSAEAEQQWKQALAIDPRSEVALEGLSDLLLDRKDYVDVVGLLQHAPRTEKLAINLSKAFGLLNYLDQASDVLNDALKLAPNSVPLASAMTVVLFKQTRYEEAIKLLQFTVQKNPGNQQAEVELFRALVLTSHINLARTMASKLLAERPHDPQVLYLAGIVDRSVGQYDVAKAHLEEAVSLEPEFFYSRYNLGMVLNFLHEWKEAKENLEKALALGDTQAETHFELAKALRGLGETEEATHQIQIYQAQRKLEEAKLEAAMNVAQADKDLTAGNVQEAILKYRSACEEVQDSATYKYKLAQALHQANDTEGERAQLEAAVKLDPKLAGAQKELGYLLARAGDATGAIEHFKLAVEAAPAWTEAWVNLAGELAEDGQFDDARKAAAMALRLDPQNEQVRALNDQLARDPNAQQAKP